MVPIVRGEREAGPWTTPTSIGSATPTRLPTHLELPDTDGKPVDNIYQPLQGQLLSATVKSFLSVRHPQRDYVLGRDLGIYWKLTTDPLDGCKCPDWCYIPGVPGLLDGDWRRSYVMWNERVSPLLVIEFVSGDGSEERDDTPVSGRYWVYRRGISAGYYAIHDPKRKTLEVFHREGVEFVPMKPNSRGHFVVPEMDLALGMWDGTYEHTPATWIRFFTLDGVMLPSDEERETLADRRIADAERQRTLAERDKADAERRASALAEKLRAAGIDPDA